MLVVAPDEVEPTRQGEEELMSILRGHCGSDEAKLTDVWYDNRKYMVRFDHTQKHFVSSFKELMVTRESAEDAALKYVAAKVEGHNFD